MLPRYRGAYRSQSGSRQFNKSGAEADVRVGVAARVSTVEGGQPVPGVVVVAAGIWGKLKTAFTMFALIAVMFLVGYSGFDKDIFIINEILIWISAVLTVISGGIYLKGYWSYIDSSK